MLEAAWRYEGDDLVLFCHLQPGARKTELAGLYGGRLKIRINAPPVEGKANTQLIQFLSHLFALPRRQVVIESGELGRQKRVRIIAPPSLPEALLAQLEQ